MFKNHQHRSLRGGQSVDNIPYSFRSDDTVGDNRRGRMGSRNENEIREFDDSSRAVYNSILQPQPFDTSIMRSLANWRPTHEDVIRHRRPASLNRYANHFHQHAKDGFVYWPVERVYKTPKSHHSRLYQHRNYVSLLIL